MRICTMGLMIGLAMGCTGTTAVQPKNPQAILVGGMNSTGVSLATKLLPNAEKGNLVISPYSGVMAHLMLAYGCKGRDRTDLLKGLGLSALGDDQSILQSAGLQNVLTGIAGNPFTSPDALMTIGDAKPVEAFKNQIQKAFGGEFFALSKDGALEKVNKWAADKSKDRIPHLLDALPIDVGLVLMNAATFDGEWQEPFDPHHAYNGEPANFTTADGTKIVADMMFRRQMSTPTVSARTFDAVSLPYKDKAFSMVVMLPHEGSTPAAVLEELSEGAWPKVYAGLQPAPVQVSMPKFTIRSKCDLIAPLRGLGISRIFDGFNARGMATWSVPPPDQVVLDLQEAYIEVDELGTKAAAVTIIGIKAGAMPAQPRTRFTVNRPFVYAVVHNDTGLMTFLGVCSTPPVAKAK